MALALSAGLFAAIFLVRLAVDGSTEAISMFYVLPIALVGMTFGARAGLAASLVGCALVAAWVAIDDISLTPLGWLSRVVPMLLLGVLAGLAAEGERAAEIAERELAAAQVRARDAAEINDTIIQGLVAAKWALETGMTDHGLDTLTESITSAQDLVAELLSHYPLDAGILRRIEPASVTRTPRGPAGPCAS